jgi:hypothetical protein
VEKHVGGVLTGWAAEEQQPWGKTKDIIKKSCVCQTPQPVKNSFRGDKGLFLCQSVRRRS